MTTTTQHRATAAWQQVASGPGSATVIRTTTAPVLVHVGEETPAPGQAGAPLAGTRELISFGGLPEGTGVFVRAADGPSDVVVIAAEQEVVVALG